MKANIGLELVTIEASDLDTIRAWRNSPAIWRWSRQPDLISEAGQKAWFERIGKDDTARFYKVVRTIAGATQAVGGVSLSGIDWINRRAEFGVYVAPQYHRQGVGKEAVRLLLLHAFLNLNLEQVWGETMDGNPALQIFEALGFQKDGTRRMFYFKDGKMHDSHIVSILRSEWASRQRAVSEPSSVGAEHRGGDSSEPERPIPAPPPTKSVAGATGQTRIRRAQKDAGRNGGRSVSLVERAGITPANGGPETIDV